MESGIHHILTWLSNSFLTIWRPLSIGLTGAFGILGLLKNFKEKKRDAETDTTVEKVTKWGWVSLIGIILSSTLGIAAQLVESNKNRSEANETRMLLLPLEEPKLDIVFEISCDGNLWYRELCVQQSAPQSHFGELRPPSEMDDLTVTLDLFRNAQRADECISGGCMGDLHLKFLAKGKAFGYHAGGAENMLLKVRAADMPSVGRRMAEGGIRSALEIPDAVTIVTVSVEQKPPLGVLYLGGIGMTLKDGSQYRAHAAFGSKVSSDGTTLNEVYLNYK